MKPLILTLALLAAAPLPFLRSSNSERLTEAGRRAFEEGDAEAAAQHFARAAEIDPSRQTLFNLGTALVQSGDAERGTAALVKASEEGGAIAADSTFNRGNVELNAQQLDEAIELYAESLRLDPTRLDAKRNLEIALRRKSQQQENERQQQGDDPRQQQSEEPSPQPQGEGEDQTPPPQPGDEGGPEELSPEEILRSVAQQEREEMSRMRQRRSEGRVPVGW